METIIAPVPMNEASEAASKRAAQILLDCSMLSQLIRLTRHDRSEFEQESLTNFTRQLFLEIAEMSPQILINGAVETPQAE